MCEYDPAAESDEGEDYYYDDKSYNTRESHLGQDLSGVNVLSTG